MLEAIESELRSLSLHDIPAHQISYVAMTIRCFVALEEVVKETGPKCILVVQQYICHFGEFVKVLYVILFDMSH